MRQAVILAGGFGTRLSHVVSDVPKPLAPIGKNKFTKEEMQEGFDGIREFYKKESVDFHDIEYCYYHKDSVIKEYVYNTILRKPNPEMILTACEKLKIDLKHSVMVGDDQDIDNMKLPYLKKEGEKQWI